MAYDYAQLSVYLSTAILIMQSLLVVQAFWEKILLRLHQRVNGKKATYALGSTLREESNICGIHAIGVLVGVKDASTAKQDEMHGGLGLCPTLDNLSAKAFTASILEYV